MQLSSKLRRTESGHSHWCPGCQQLHHIPDGLWNFDGNVEVPTFSPSVKISGLQTVRINGRWTGEWMRDAQGNPLPFCCHYFITAGEIRYCADSTHALAGKNVPLPALPQELCD